MPKNTKTNLGGEKPGDDEPVADGDAESALGYVGDALVVAEQLELLGRVARLKEQGIQRHQVFVHGINALIVFRDSIDDNVIDEIGGHQYQSQTAEH